MREIVIWMASVWTVVVPQAMAQTRVTDVDGRWSIANINVTGNHRYSPEQVARVSGLALRMQVSIGELDKTLGRMAGTGLFARIGYRYSIDKVAGGQLTLTFEVEEPEWKVPVVFDNFVWFTDQELMTAVQADVPTFDGTLPMTAGATALMVRSLESFLKRRELAGRVVVRTQIGDTANPGGYLFRVENAVFPICAVAVTGESDEMAGGAAKAVSGIVGTAYSRASVGATARFALVDLYQKRGYLRAVVGAPLHTLNGICQGVSVEIPVLEGVQYRWGGVEWTGVSAARAAELDRIMDLPAEAPADVSALETRRRAVQHELDRAGHIEARVTYTFRLNADARRAHVAIQVTEGPLFRMGSVEFVNLPPSDRALLAKAWAIKEHDVYDGTYLATFVRDHLSALSRRLKLSGFRPVVTIPPGSTTVNIRIDFSRQ
jgi:outer membrane protein insertion porin family